ncbi:hypothetical protein [Vibrio sp. 10N.239.312.D08]|uniref:hypothetical protein n=1 Tax=Vibrio sp. 10N.239.312.D08 TaxID=3229978 RepID=UPI00354BF39D
MTDKNKQWQAAIPSIGPTHIDLNLGSIMIGPTTSIGFEQIRGQGLFSLKIDNNTKLASSISEASNGLHLYLVDVATLKANNKVAEMHLNKAQIEILKDRIDHQLSEYAP